MERRERRAVVEPGVIGELFSSFPFFVSQSQSQSHSQSICIYPFAHVSMYLSVCISACCLRMLPCTVAHHNCQRNVALFGRST